MIEALKTIVSWRPHTRNLEAMTRMEDFLAYVQKVKYEHFFLWQGKSSQKRQEFGTIIQELCITLDGKSVLDLGPGYGDAIDICHESGAKTVDFVEIDPFLYTFNKLKGFGCAYRLNLLWQLNRLSPGKYDLIWSKGSICADLFIEWRVFLSLARWLRGIERAASRSSIIIICPHWRNNGTTRKLVDFRNTGFTKTMMMAGFTALQSVCGHNRQPDFPITFVKQISSDIARN